MRRNRKTRPTQTKKTQKERSKKSIVHVRAAGTPYTALLCMSVSVFPRSFSLLYLMLFGLQCKRQQTHTHTHTQS